MQAFGVETWEEVLAFFQDKDSLFHERWGWLEILRRAQDGDLILANPWNIPGLEDTYQGWYQINRNGQGELFVGNFEHSLFCHHQSIYTLVPTNGGEFFTTQSWLMHLHRQSTRHSVTDDDKTTVALDVISMVLEIAGIAGALPTSGTGFVVAEFAQLGLDLLGSHGAATGLMNWTFDRRANMGYTSDDVLGVLGATPGIGLITDIADIYSHATGWEFEWRP